MDCEIMVVIRLKNVFSTPAIVVAFLAVQAILLLHSTRYNFIALDEPAHVVAGISHWRAGDYSMFCVNPPLVRMLAVVPVFFLRPDTTCIKPVRTPGLRAEWQVGEEFVKANRSILMKLFFLTRLAGILYSLLGSWILFRWARDLYGTFAGCLGAAIWCFGPNVLANAQMVSEDVPAAVGGAAAAYSFWRYLRQPTELRAATAGILLGVALLTKFTLLVFLVIWPCLAVFYSWKGKSDAVARFRTGWRRRSRQGFILAVLSLLVVNCGYEFQGTCRRLKEYSFVSRALAGEPAERGLSGNRFHDHWLGNALIPLPEDYVLGIDLQRREFEVSPHIRPSFLAGEWRAHGWWYYYLYALALKVPLGVWGLVLWGLVLTLIRHPSTGHWVDEIFLWLPALGVLVLVSSQTGINRHMRYVLPMFPFVVIATSKVAYFFERRYWPAGMAVVALLLWAVVSSLLIHPHYLSYFNEAAGGPDNGYRHLENSNIDWGQDLLFLKNWLEKHPEARPLGLAYYNAVDPQFIGIDYELPPLGPTAEIKAPDADLAALGPKPGYFAVSANLVVGSPYRVPDGHGGRRYIALRGYDYFNHFRPIAKAGYSIFIYHITRKEANSVRSQLRLPLLSDSE
jgi:4-amino-4-deoxy-L-arabinose transferase-like glycosyltransferase